jgi:hypothetical protein
MEVQPVGVLEQRRMLIESNDAIVRALNGESQSDRVTIRCECGDPTCDDEIEVALRDVSHVREFAEEHAPGTFIAARGHDIPDLEEGSEFLTGDSWVQASPRPLWVTPLDPQTLEARVEAEAAEANANRQEIDAAHGRLNTLVSTGVLVLGLFTTLRPNDVESLPLVWLLLPIVPMLGLVWEAVYQAASVRTAVRKAFTPGRHVTFAELGEWERNRYRLRPTSGEVGANIDYLRPPGISYESYSAYRRAEQHDPFSPMSYLPYDDYLAYELRRQSRRRVITLDAVYAITQRENRARGYLALLLIYVVLVTALA